MKSDCPPTKRLQPDATAVFFRHRLLAKLAYSGANHAGPQLAESQALYALFIKGTTK